MRTLQVTVIQSNLHWEDRAANLRMFEEKIGAVREKMELVLLPEMFSTGFSMHPGRLAEPMDGASVTWMRRVSAEKRIILAGSLIIEEQGKYFNRLIWMLPNGGMGYYDKRHLFAYAGENQVYSPGSARLIASAKGWRINLQVCYDLRFPVWARQTVAIPFSPPQPDPAAAPAATQIPSDRGDSLSPSAVNPLSLSPEPTAGLPRTNPPSFAETDTAREAVPSGSAAPYAGPEYDVLVYVANWPHSRIHAWKTLLRARAIENQSYVIGVNRVGTDGNGIYYSGDSMIIDPVGEVLQTVTDQEAAITATLNPEILQSTREKFPFLKDADPFLIGQ